MLTRLLIFAALASAALSALDPKSLQPQGYINDFAGVVDAPGRADINRYCAAVERATGAQIAIVTLRTLENAPIEDFANDLFRQWGIGQKGAHDGVLLLFAIDDRKSRFEVGRGLEPVITDGAAGSILRAMRPALRSGDYASAFSTAAHEIGQKIAESKGVTIDESDRPSRRARDTGGTDIPSAVVFFLFLLFAMFIFGRMGRGGGGGYRRGGGGFLPGLILGNMMGRGPYYGGTSGGGFGGYDSGGGGFGGFGGGDSGGGGASSDW